MTFLPSRLRASSLIVLLLAVSTLVSRGYADDVADAKAALKKAQAAQDEAPACRMTMTSTERDVERVNVMVTEFVKPASMHTRMEINGRVAMEMLTDGTRTLMRQGGEPELKEAPAHVNSMLLTARKSVSLDALSDSAKDVHFEGHETVDGKPASAYTFTTDQAGVSTSTKVWISDVDGRPIKAEADSHGEMRFGAGVSRKTNSHSVTTFDYDPAIKITLPAG